MKTRRWLDVLFPVCLSLAIFLALIAALELGLRRLHGPPQKTALPENFRYAHLDVLKPFFKRTWNGWGRSKMTPQRPQSTAASFLLPKPSGRLRVFIVGGSVASPFSAEGGTKFSSFTTSVLPGREVEVISCGMGSYDSRREAGVLRQILDYQPDLVVLLSGNNEYHGREVPHPRFVMMDHFLSAYSLYGFFKERVRTWKAMPREPINFGPEEADPRFEQNLRAMARMCRERNIPLVLNTLGANLRDSPPTSNHPRLDDPPYFNALRTWEEGNYALAAEQFHRFLARFPEDPFGLYYLAKSQDRLRKYGEAKRNYTLAADFDRPGTRTSPARNKIIRRVAREEGAILSDLEKVFVTLAPQGIPGAESFRDSCHWMHEYYPLASLTILRAVYEFNRTQKAAVLAPADAWQWAWASGLEGVLRKPTIGPEMAEHYFDDTLHSALAAAAVAAKNRLSEESIHMMQQSLRRDPAKFERMTMTKKDLDPLFNKHWFQDYRQRVDEIWPMVLVHIGEAWRREGRPDLALVRFSTALVLQPDCYQARLRRAIATASLGRWAAARPELDSLIDEFPKRDEPRLWAQYLNARRTKDNPIMITPAAVRRAEAPGQ